MKKVIISIVLLTITLGLKAQDATERAILQRVGISANDEGLSINDEGHIFSVNLSNRGLKTIPFLLLELPYVVDINLGEYVPWTEDVDRIQESGVRIQKILRDGQIYIVRGEKVFTLTGQEVR